MAGHVLEQEIQTFEANKEELLGKARGKFALIKDDDIVDVFDTQMDAIWRGYEHFGNEPFLVKEVREIEIPQNFTSTLLAC